GGHFYHGLNGLAPLGIGHAENTDTSDATPLHDDRFYLCWIDIFTPRFDQRLFRFTLHVIEVTIHVKAPHVAGVMPTTAEDLSSDVRLVKVALKHDGAAHQDFSGRAQGDILIRFIHQADLAQGYHFAGAARTVCDALQRHKTTRLSLTK